jgi:sec-independent protein translocase protein TatA
MNPMFLFLGSLGPMEIFLIVMAILLLFGGKKIPELMRGIGKGIREFNSARANIEEEFKDGMRESERKRVEDKG